MEEEQSARHEFPIMLYDMLEEISLDPAKTNIVSWMPHGRAFRVHRPEEFETRIMPDYFQERYGSFRLLLEQWGFLRLSRGKDRGAYYNVHFLRGHRSKIVGVDKLFMEKDMPEYLSPRDEPNLYLEPDVSTIGKKKRGRPSKKSDGKDALSSASSALAASLGSNSKDNQDLSANSDTNGTSIEETGGKQGTVAAGVSPIPIASQTSKKRKSSVPRKILDDSNITQKKPISVAVAASASNTLTGTTNDDEGSNTTNPTTPTATTTATGNKRKGTAPSKVNTDEKEILASHNSGSGNKRKAKLPTKVDTDEKEILASPSTASNKKKATLPATKNEIHETESSSAKITRNIKKKVASSAAWPSDEQKEEGNAFSRDKGKQNTRKQSFVEAKPIEEQEKSARHDFPIMVYDMLEAISYDEFRSKMCSWQPHGRAFKVHKPDDFETSVMPDFFTERYASFRFLLERWGFVRLSRGRDRGAYYNIHFIRGQREQLIGATKENMKKDMPQNLSPREEPNFYIEYEKMEKEKEANKKKQPPPSSKSQKANKQDEDSNMAKNRKNPPRISARDSIDTSKQQGHTSPSFPEAMDIDVLHNDGMGDDDDSHDISEIPQHNLMVQGASETTTTGKKSGKKGGEKKNDDTNTNLVSSPHENDVLFGRGGRTNKWSGNENLRRLAREKYCLAYQKAPKKEKSSVTLELVREIRSLNPPGRFLRQIVKEDSSSATPAQWEDVGDDAACTKVSQVIRDEYENMGYGKMGYVRYKNRKSSSGSITHAYNDDDDDNTNNNADDDLMVVGDDDGRNSDKKRKREANKTKTKKPGRGGTSGGQPPQKKKEKTKEQKEKERIKLLMTVPLCQYYLPPIY